MKKKATQVFEPLVFKRQAKKRKESAPPVERSFKKLWHWQPDAYRDMKDARFGLICAFCGSGKTILQVILGGLDVIRSKGRRKQLYVVPQGVIAKGFVRNGKEDELHVEIERRRYHWRVDHNFCDRKAKQVLEGLKTWLLTPVPLEARNLLHKKVISGSVAVATHAALGQVWDMLKPDERRRAMQNLTLWIDEAHHVNNVYDYEDPALTDSQQAELELISTKLGEICRYVMHKTSSQTRLFLTTATPYRGDKHMILSKEVETRFKKYYLEWMKHWDVLNLKDFSIYYDEYDGRTGPLQQIIQRIKAEPNEKHMIVVPGLYRKWRKNKSSYPRFLERLRKAVGADKVLDLVTKSTQTQNKARFELEPTCRPDGPSKYTVIVTCMIGREGMDWVPCSRLHNTSPENSLTLTIQTMGRPFRAYYKKKHIKIFNYMRKFDIKDEERTKRELISDRTNASLIGMMWEDAFNPLMIPVIPDDKGTVAQPLQKVLGDKYQPVMSDCIEEISALQKGNRSVDSMLESIRLVVRDHKLPKENREAIEEGLLRAIGRRFIKPPSGSGSRRSPTKGTPFTDWNLDLEALRSRFDVILEKQNRWGAQFLGDLGDFELHSLTKLLRNRMKEREWMFQALKQKYGTQ